MDYPGQSKPCAPSNADTAINGNAKKNETPLVDAIDKLLGDSDVCKRHYPRLRRHVLSSLVCLGRRTITGLLTTAGRQFRDWSADYRLYAKERVEPADLFGAARRAIVQATDNKQPIIAALDDTRLPHTGRKIPGVKYTRDPMGPPFHVNFIRAQRFVQISLALPTEGGAARMVPVDFVHAPSPNKPRMNANESDWADYRKRRRRESLAQVGVARLAVLREQLDRDGCHDRALWVSGDGSYTNGSVLKQLPERTVFIGRIRADAKLYDLPQDLPSECGRPRVYGRQLPTPEKIRKDPDIPWVKVTAFAAGRKHAFRIKTIQPIRWRASGKAHDLRLIVIAPLAYRVRQGSRLLYRKPAYLICTDPSAPLEQVLQAYLWRWDIEVNFREEKSIVGAGEAKVRHPKSVEHVPALAVASYSLLLMGAAQAYGHTGLPNILPRPKWRPDEPARPSTQTLINHLRYELWHTSLNKSHFASQHQPNTKSQKNDLPLRSALFYATTAG